MKENSDTDQEEGEDLNEDSEDEDSDCIIDLEKDADEGKTMEINKPKKNSLWKIETSNSSASASEEVLRMLSFNAL